MMLLGFWALLPDGTLIRGGDILAFCTVPPPLLQGSLALPEPVYCNSQLWGRGYVERPLGTLFLFLPPRGWR